MINTDCVNIILMINTDGIGMMFPPSKRTQVINNVWSQLQNQVRNRVSYQHRNRVWLKVFR